MEYNRPKTFQVGFSFLYLLFAEVFYHCKWNLNIVNVNKWPKLTTVHLRRDWALVGLMMFFSKSTHMTPPQNFENKKLALIKHLCKVK